MIFSVYAAWPTGFPGTRQILAFTIFSKWKCILLKGDNFHDVVLSPLFASLLPIFYCDVNPKYLDGSFLLFTVFEFQFWWGDDLFGVCHLTPWLSSQTDFFARTIFTSLKVVSFLKEDGCLDVYFVPRFSTPCFWHLVAISIRRYVDGFLLLLWLFPTLDRNLFGVCRLTPRCYSWQTWFLSRMISFRRKSFRLQNWWG